MPIIICSYCEYVGDTIEDVLEHEKICKYRDDLK
jgi:hypothetical protein